MAHSSKLLIVPSSRKSKHCNFLKSGICIPVNLQTWIASNFHLEWTFQVLFTAVDLCWYLLLDQGLPIHPQFWRIQNPFTDVRLRDLWRRLTLAAWNRWTFRCFLGTFLCDSFVCGFSSLLEEYGGLPNHKLQLLIEAVYYSASHLSF